MSILDDREKILKESENYLPITEEWLLSQNFIKRNSSYTNIYRFELSINYYVEVWGPLADTMYMGVNTPGQLICIKVAKVRNDVLDFVRKYERMAY